MNTMRKLLVALTAMGVLASVPVEIVAQAQSPYIPAPKDSASVFTSDGSTVYSFADIANLRAVADNRLLTRVTSRHVAYVAQADVSNVVADSTAAQSEDAASDTAGSMLGAGSTPSGPIDDVSGVVDPDHVSKSQSGGSRWHTDAGFLFSITDVPEPNDWMTLLCGLVVVAFMARRKNGPFAD